MAMKSGYGMNGLAPKTTARIAGIFYLVLGICAGWSWSFLGSITVPGDAVATVNNIRASEGLYRLSFVASLVGQVAFLFLVYFLYQLLKGVNKSLARIMVLLVVVSIPIAILNLLSCFAPLLILNGKYLSVFSSAQISSLAMLSLDLHNYGVFIASVFWGLWLFPLGYLIIRSGFIPGIIGVLMVIAGLGYVIDSFLRFLLPGYNLALSSYTFMGEVALILWFLIRGVRVPKKGTES